MLQREERNPVKSSTEGCITIHFAESEENRLPSSESSDVDDEMANPLAPTVN